MSGGNGFGELECSALGESLGSYSGAEISSSCGILGGEVSGNPEGSQMGGSSIGM